MTETFLMRMPTVAEFRRTSFSPIFGFQETAVSAPRAIILLKDFGIEVRYLRWKERCVREREKNIRPHASPAMPR